MNVKLNDEQIDAMLGIINEWQESVASVNIDSRIGNKSARVRLPRETMRELCRAIERSETEFV